MIFWCTYILSTEHRHCKLESYWWLLSQASKNFAMEEQGACDYYYDCNGEVFFVWWNGKRCVTTGTTFESHFAMVCGWSRELKQKSQYSRNVTPMREVLIIMTAWLGSMLLVLRKTWSLALFTRMVMALVTAWLLYRHLHGTDTLDLMLLLCRLALCFCRTMRNDLLSSIRCGKFSQKHNYKYMAKWWCLLALEKLHVSAYSGHHQVFTTFLLKSFI